MVGGRRPLVEDDLRWKTTSVGRQPLVEDDLGWKTTFGGRQPLVEDDLWWKMTYGGRRPSVEDDFWWKTILACCLVRFAAFLSYELKFYKFYKGPRFGYRDIYKKIISFCNSVIHL